MPANLDQRYVPTDLRSQILHFLWSVGLDKAGDRDLLATIVMNFIEERRTCTNGSSTN